MLIQNPIVDNIEVCMDCVSCVTRSVKINHKWVGQFRKASVK